MPESQRNPPETQPVLESEGKSASVSCHHESASVIDCKVACRCLEHIVNLAIVAIMGSITKIAAIENAQAIWEYDPTIDDNRVLGGSLDIIAAIRTITIKIRASGQRIEYFEQLQSNCKIPIPLKLEVHNNTRWGTAYGMIERARDLRQVKFHSFYSICEK